MALVDLRWHARALLAQARWRRTRSAIAQWLAQAREQAQALPVQAQLQQAPVDPIAQAKGKNAVMRPAPSQDTGARWRGTVVLSLP